MARKQFTFYRSFWENIEKLETNKEKLQAYQLLCSYALEKQEPDLNAVKPCAAMVFRLVRPVLDTAHNRSLAAIKMNERLHDCNTNVYDLPLLDIEKEIEKDIY